MPRQVLRRCDQDGFGLDDLAHHHVGRQALARADQRDVEVLHRRLQRRVDLDLEPDVGVALAERRQQRRDDVRGQHRRRVDAQHAGQLAAVRAHQRIGLVDLLQDGAHPHQVRLAGFGERQPARAALEQPRLQVVLEIGDQARHRSGRQLQGTGRRGEAAFVGDALEHAHGEQSVHREGLEWEGPDCSGKR
jgi:hypothetical protein